MAGIGEAASIVGVLQFGFSLAKTLTEYIGEFKAAADNITTLANNIEVTFRQADELQSLLKTNQTTQGFSEAARINAVSCCLKAEKLGEQLWQMLGKSNVARPVDRAVERKDIDLSLFHQALWPRFKPRVEEAERKFLLLKLDITIALVSYHGNNNLPETPRGLETLENLKKSRKFAVHELRAARKKRRGVKSRHAHFDADIPSPPVRQTSRDSYSQADDYYYHPPPPRQSAYYGSGRDWDVDEASVTSSMYNDIEESVLKFQEQDVTRRKAAEEERVMREKLTLEAFQKQLVEKIRESRLHAEQTRSKLSELFDVPSNAPAIDAYITDLQARDLASDEVANTIYTQLNGLLVAKGRDTEKEAVGKIGKIGKMAHGPKMWSSLASRWKRPTSIVSLSTYDNLPMFQPNEFAGRQNFVGLVLCASDNGRVVHRIGVSRAWLQHALAMEAKEILKKGGPNHTAKAYSQISTDDAALLTNKLLEYGYRGRGKQIVYARELNERSSRSRQFLQMVAFGPEIRRLQHRSMLLVYFIHGDENTADALDSNRVDPESMLPQNTEVEPIASRDYERPATPPEIQITPSPAELVTERRKSRRPEPYSVHIPPPPPGVYPMFHPAPTMPVQVAAGAPDSRRRDRPTRGSSYDRSEYDADIDYPYYGNKDYSGREYESHPPGVAERIFRSGSDQTSGLHHTRSSSGSGRPQPLRPSPMINVYNDQSYGQRVGRDNSSQPAYSPYLATPSHGYYDGDDYTTPRFLAPTPRVRVADADTSRPELVDYTFYERTRPRSRSNYRRWQNDKRRARPGHDDIEEETDVLESSTRRSKRNGRVSPFTDHDRGSNTGRSATPAPSASRVVTVEESESSDDSGTEYSEVELSDTSITSSKDKSWARLKHEAAAREKKAMSPSRRRVSASTSFTGDDLPISGSPGSVSDVDEEGPRHDGYEGSAEAFESAPEHEAEGNLQMGIWIDPRSSHPRLQQKKEDSIG